MQKCDESFVELTDCTLTLQHSSNILDVKAASKQARSKTRVTGERLRTTTTFSSQHFASRPELPHHSTILTRVKDGMFAFDEASEAELARRVADQTHEYRRTHPDLAPVQWNMKEEQNTGKAAMVPRKDETP